MRREITIVLWAILMLFPCGLAFSAWSTDPAVNNPVCTAPYDQSVSQLVSDGSGGAIIVWPDQRKGFPTFEPDIYAQRLDFNGNALWTTDGVPVCTAPERQSNPRLTSDGSGGAIVIWSDSRPGASGTYAQRLDSSGNPLWTTDGVLIADGSEHQLISDGSGGAIVAYEGATGGIGVDIYAQRLDSHGNVLWTAGGVPICTAIQPQEHPQLISDGSGGAIITWQDSRLGSHLTFNDIYAQRVDSSGNVLWTANGAAVCTATGGQFEPKLDSDGSGGAIITWDDERGINNDIYAQRVDSNGNALWTTDGVPVCIAIRHQRGPEIISDGSGGAIIAWNDRRKVPGGEDLGDIYAQRLDLSGNALWTVDGVRVTTVTRELGIGGLISDDSGGAIITWGDDRNGVTNRDIFAQRLDSSGSALWTVDGVPVSTAIDRQSGPLLISDGSGGAIITWTDDRSISKWADIYAQLVNSDGGLGLPPVTVEVIPDSTSISRGGTLGYQVTITNNTASSQTFQFWTNVTLPNGNIAPSGRELIGPVTVTLGPNASKSGHPSHTIPSGAPLGAYTYHAYVGTHPTVGDKSDFTFDVVSP